MSAASPAPASPWKLQQSYPIALVAGAAVSCPTTTDCWAAGRAAPGVSAIFVSTDAGATWAEQLRTSAVYSVADISCPSTSTCFAVGGTPPGRGVVLATTDGGRTWSVPAILGNSSYLRSISCPDTSDCTAVGSAGGFGVVIGTRDGGTTWTGQAQLAAYGSALTGVSCPDSARCVAVGTAVITTSDGGTTWTAASPGYAGFLSTVACAGAADCWAITGASVVRSSDGGSTWATQTLPSVTGTYETLSGITCSRSGFGCWIVGSYVTSGSYQQALVFATANGATWVRQGGTDTFDPLGGLSALNGIACPSSSDCVAVGEQDTLAAYTAVSATTGDGGVHWASFDLPSTVGAFSAVSCPSSADCMALGSSQGVNGVAATAEVAVTTDGGSVWQRLVPPALAYRGAVSCPSTTECWAIGQAGLVETVNFGATWSTHAVTSVTLSGIDCPGTSDCWAVGQSFPGQTGVILATTDGGSTWNQQTIPTGSNFLSGVSCPTTADCWAAGGSFGSPPGTYSGVVLATTNGGATWRTQALPTGTPELGSVSCPTTSTCRAVGESYSYGYTAQVVATNNAGVSWIKQSLPSGAGMSSGVGGISCPTSSRCWIAATNSGLVATTDGGATWQEQATTGAYVQAVACADVSNCWSVGAGYNDGGGAIFSTSDAPVGGPFGLSELVSNNPSEIAAYLCQVCAGDPVDTASGTFSQTYDDLSIPGRGVRLLFTHSYNSFAASVNGPLGYGWSNPYGMSLSFDASGNATVHQANGSTVAFANEAGAFTAAPRVIATLVKNPDGTYTFTRAAKEIFDFNASGQLVDEKDLNGLALTLAYTAGQLATVTDPAGRQLTFAWSGGHIVKITDPLGRTVSFVYDTSGNLSDVHDANGGDTHLTYDAGHLLLTIRRPAQDPAAGGDGHVVTNTYDAQHRVTKQVDALGRTTTFAYAGTPSSAAGGKTTVTDPQGRVTVDDYVFGERVATTKAFGTSSAATWTFAYDPATLGVTSVTDPNGHTTTSTYDAVGDRLTSTDPLGRTTTNTYSPLGDQLTSTDPMGVTTTNSYDAQGNLLTRTRPLLGSTGAVTANQTTSYAVCESPTCTVGADQYREGDVESVTDPLGHTTTDAYDASGNLVSVTDAAGDTTTYTYNAAGWKLTKVAPLGNVAGCACAAAHTTTYGYVDPTSGAHDGFGTIRSVTDPLGHTTGYTYDPNGNLVAARDGAGHATAYVFDDASEKIATHLPDGSIQRTAYWPDGAVKDQIDGSGRDTQYTYDPLGHRSSTVDPLGATTRDVFDAVGNLRSTTDAKGNTTTYAYDAADELTATTYSDAFTPNVSAISYNADGQRTGMTDGTGAWTWTYDSLQRLTNVTEGAQGAVAYRYDLGNNLTAITYPGGHTVSRAYDAVHRLALVTDWQANRTTFAYDRDSNLTVQKLPAASGVVDRFTYGAQDGLSGVLDARNGAPLFAAKYGRNANEQLSSDGSVPAPSGPGYGYTGLNQLCYAGPATSTACPAPASGRTTFQYDPAGNMIQDGPGAQAFNAAGELCWTRSGSSARGCATPPAGSTSYTYDADGNRTRVAPAAGAVTTLGYDQTNRLATYAQGSLTASYRYSGDGLRMMKTVATTTTGFVWDTAAASPLLLTAGSIDYVYGPGGLPLEQIAGASVTWLHHDQLGSTRLMTTTSGAVAATYTYGAYGATVTHTGPSGTQLGYAGQYADPETGLIYLRARYYDPATGQFLTRDPAVAVTRAPYAYGSGNPLNSPDPTGLGSCPNGVAIPLTDLCLDNPLDLQRDGQNFDQNSKTLESVPVAGDIIKADPFYVDIRDGIYRAQGVPVSPGQIVTDGLQTSLAFLPGAGAILEGLGFEGGGAVVAGNLGRATNYRIGAVAQNNSALIEQLLSGPLAGTLGGLLLGEDASGGLGGLGGLLGGAWGALAGVSCF